MPSEVCVSKSGWLYLSVSVTQKLFGGGYFRIFAVTAFQMTSENMQCSIAHASTDEASAVHMHYK